MALIKSTLKDGVAIPTTLVFETYAANSPLINIPKTLTDLYTTIKVSVNSTVVIDGVESGSSYVANQVYNLSDFNYSSKIGASVSTSSPTSFTVTLA